MKLLFIVVGLLALSQESGQKPDATALETQYKTCSKHYIPAEKCTPEIYQQLKVKDSQPTDPDTALALEAVNEYRTRLKNPSSMQIRSVYIVPNRCKKCTPDDKVVCLDASAQNGFGGMTASRATRETVLGKVRWYYESDSDGPFPIHYDPWRGSCSKSDTRSDVTERVNQAIKNAQ